MNFQFIIVQCGGKGTRLKHHTLNKPKALVAVQNKPIIFHLFDKYPDKKFIIISDYKSNVLNKYLETFAKIEYVSIETADTGNIAGIKEALSYIPDNESFLLLWSDLILRFNPEDLPANNYIGVTNKFKCSWIFKDHHMEKISTDDHGIAGCFLFENKSIIENLPVSGSFTTYIKQFEDKFDKMDIGDSIEIGTVESLEKNDPKENRCRPYNQITFEDETVIKKGLTNEAEILLDRERDWYEKISQYNFTGIPKIYSMNPLKMEKIHGKNIFLADIPHEKKPMILKKFVDTLKNLHNLEHQQPNLFDMQKDYYQKTIDRLQKIFWTIPFSTESEITINDQICKNPLIHTDLFRRAVNVIKRQATEFGIIHGDCTFTNTLIDEDDRIYFIDARGYFGNTKLFGDVDYDFAKVYYSIVGSFDEFNVKNFELTIDQQINYSIQKSGWQHLEEYFFELIPNSNPAKIKFIHSIIWLSLASHCFEDYDSMTLAFYNGTYLWNAAIKELEL